MTDAGITRRHVLGAAAGIAVLGSHPSRAQTALPTSPVVLNVLDGAGSLRQTQRAFEAYQRVRPELVSHIIYSEAPALKVPSRLKAGGDAGRAEFDLVLARLSTLSTGIEQGLWLPLFPDHAARLPNLQTILLRPAWDMQRLARGQGVVVSYCPSGPLLEYMPQRVKPVPGTAEELLAWARAHPKRFLYARPAKSDAGRSFLMGLPYVLGDADPKEPERGWDQTWAYLQALGTAIEYYPAGTGATLAELRDGYRDMIATTTAADMASRVLHEVPQEAEIAALKGFHWVTDAHYAAVPKGLSGAKVTVLLDLISFLLTKEAQAFAYDLGSFYPGPAVAGVTLALAPQRSQDQLRGSERPEYESLIADNPTEVPLGADKLAYALRRWEEQIGASKAR